VSILDKQHFPDFFSQSTKSSNALLAYPGETTFRQWTVFAHYLLISQVDLSIYPCVLLALLRLIVKKRMRLIFGPCTQFALDAYVRMFRIKLCTWRQSSHHPSGSQRILPGLTREGNLDPFLHRLLSTEFQPSQKKPFAHRFYRGFEPEQQEKMIVYDLGISLHTSCR
jgi:hypothetical protein